MQRGQDAQQGCCTHVDRLRAEQQPATVKAVGNCSAQQRKNDVGQRGGKGHKAEQEGRIGHLQYLPALTNRLNPEANAGEKCSRPEETKLLFSQRMQGGGQCEEMTFHRDMRSHKRKRILTSSCANCSSQKRMSVT